MGIKSYLPITFSGRLSADQVNELTHRLNLSVEQLMNSLVPVAASYAVVPISGFKVGAVSRGISGSLYFGANLEFVNCALNATVHAEQASISHAVSHRESGIDLISVSAAPCGHCRQFLFELNTADILKIRLPEGQPVPLTTLLPDAFGPAQLGSAKRLMDAQEHLLRLETSSSDPLVLEALKAASYSYSPYSKAFAGLTLETTRGDMLSGCSVENAAFNPGVLPLQAALVNLVLAGGNFQEISRVVLVQVRQTGGSLADDTRTLLASLSQVELIVELACLA